LEKRAKEEEDAIETLRKVKDEILKSSSAIPGANYSGITGANFDGVNKLDVPFSFQN
jgi:hypothetical protein